MYKRIAEVRLTSYALISALEQDLREIIMVRIAPHFQDLSFIGDVTQITEISKRFLKDNPGLNPTQNAKYVIEFLDFQDAYKTLLAQKDYLAPSMVMQLKKAVPILDTLVPIRNRIMHSRPLLAGDFTQVYNFCSSLMPTDILSWSNTISTIKNLTEDPSFVFTISIPTSTCPDYIPHNLPMPDFDESGFIGREDDVNDLLSLITGNTNVVSLIGDGGIGKTALMLKVAYDIVDMGENCPFDTVLWYSSKTSMLTASGIKELHNNLTSTSYVVSEFASELGAPIGKSTKENISEILDFMKEFKVLLVLDNLETVYEEEMRDFIKSASTRAKIAITSRIGLGELEYRRFLKGLSEKEAATLVRNISKMRNNDILLKLDNKQLNDIGRQLHFNPLALKWFVNSVELGNTPKAVLQNKDDLLTFCLSNVYEKLSNASKQVLLTILAARKPLNDAELAFLSDFEPLQLRHSLNQLFSTTLLQKEVNNRTHIPELLYNVTPFAKEYLLSKHSPDKEFVKSVTNKMKKLQGTFEEVTRITDVNEFDLNAIEIRNNNEKVAARYLQESLFFSRPAKHLYDQAMQRVKTAKNLAPAYFEVYRISAFVKVCNDDLLGAEEDYKLALELEPENPRTLYFYAGFLASQMQDAEAAKPYACKALELRPNSPQTNILYARCVGYAGDYVAATSALSEILFHGINMSSKYFKIATTLLINFYRRWSEDERSIKKDTKTSVELAIRGFEIFDNAILKRETDKKMSSELAELLLAYWYSVITTDGMNRVDAIGYYRTYKIYLKHTPFAEKLASVFGEGCDTISSVKISPTERFSGTIMEHFEGRFYAFIRTNKIGNVYLNKRDFTNVSDWQLIDNGTPVSFRIEMGDKGYIAKDIIIEQCS